MVISERDLVRIFMVDSSGVAIYMGIEVSDAFFVDGCLGSLGMRLTNGLFRSVCYAQVLYSHRRNVCVCLLYFGK